MNKSILILAGMVIGGALLVMANQEYKKEQAAPRPAVTEAAPSTPAPAPLATAPSESPAPAAEPSPASQQPITAPAAPSNSYTAAAQPVSPVLQDAATAPAKPATAAPAPEAKPSPAPAAAPQPKHKPAPSKAKDAHKAAPAPKAVPAPKPAPTTKAAPSAQNAQAKGGVISRIKVSPSGAGAKVHIVANSPVRYTTARMSNPDRLVIDLQGKWQVKAPGVPKNAAVSNVRLAKWEKTTRIVFDLKKKNANVHWQKTDPTQLVVEIK